MKNGEIVKKANALARGIWDTRNPWAPRILAFAIAQISDEDATAPKMEVGTDSWDLEQQRLKNMVKIQQKTYRISVARLIEKVKRSKNGKIYKEIQAGIDVFFKKPIYISPEGRNATITCALFQSIEFDRDTGEIVTMFSEAIMPYIMQIRDRYVKYNLDEYLQLDGVYAPRVYELLSTWKNIKDGRLLIEIDFLHDFLCTPKSCRRDFGQLRKNLQDAEEQINSKTNLKVHLVPKHIFGRGRKIDRILVLFGDEAIEAIEAEREAKNITRQKNDPSVNLELHAQYQQASLKCMNERLAKGLPVCTKSSRKKYCKFCLERGPAFCKKLIKDAKQSEANIVVTEAVKNDNPVSETQMYIFKESLTEDDE